MRLILASSSPTRRALFERAAIVHEAIPARIDEDGLRRALSADGVTPRDMADALAEAKARKISDKNPGAIVVGSDQILDLDGKALVKPETAAEAEEQLHLLRGKRHALHSAAVIYEDGKPVWRHVGTTRLTMRDFSDAYLSDYLGRNWDGIQGCVGAYKLEEEGVRLFQCIEGDYFVVLGIPFVELCSYLSLRGIIEG